MLQTYEIKEMCQIYWITTAEPQRCFSALKIVKSDLRNLTSQLRKKLFLEFQIATKKLLNFFVKVKKQTNEFYIQIRFFNCRFFYAICK